MGLDILLTLPGQMPVVGQLKCTAGIDKSVLRTNNTFTLPFLFLSLSPPNKEEIKPQKQVIVLLSAFFFFNKLVEASQVLRKLLILSCKGKVLPFFFDWDLIL